MRNAMKKLKLQTRKKHFFGVNILKQRLSYKYNWSDIFIESAHWADSI